MSSNLTTGNAGESLAADYLQKKGYSIVEKNWRFKHWEVDIIASRKNRLHFFEVKTRTNLHYGYPEESISFSKMESLRNAAEEYQYKHPEWKYIEFDVLSILLLPTGEIEYFLIEDVYF